MRTGRSSEKGGRGSGRRTLYSIDLVAGNAVADVDVDVMVRGWNFKLIGDFLISIFRVHFHCLSRQSGSVDTHSGCMLCRMDDCCSVVAVLLAKLVLLALMVMALVLRRLVMDAWSVVGEEFGLGCGCERWTMELTVQRFLFIFDRIGSRQQRIHVVIGDFHVAPNSYSEGIVCVATHNADWGRKVCFDTTNHTIPCHTMARMLLSWLARG